jgi:predicted HTH domain antitoxin
LELAKIAKIATRSILEESRGIDLEAFQQDEERQLVYVVRTGIFTQVTIFVL